MQSSCRSKSNSSYLSTENCIWWYLNRYKFHIYCFIYWSGNNIHNMNMLLP
ncbi:hypothetical protein X975_15105, partial [Stegodyphus mimosarum]